MTRRHLYRWTSVVIGIYVAAMLIGIGLRCWHPDEHDLIYATFKDLIPFVIAIPAAWLGFCFQRRASYLQQLRGFWSDLVEVVQSSVQYTYLTAPTQENYGAAITAVSAAVDEVRGIFKNIKEGPIAIGLYPFESLKDIKRALDDLGFGPSVTPSTAKICRDKILVSWRRLRGQLLREFDRDCPTYIDSPYVRDKTEKA
jgi:hypothetical protein